MSKSILHPTCPLRFLRHFARSEQRWVADFFHDAAALGYDCPEALVAGVQFVAEQLVKALHPDRPGLAARNLRLRQAIERDRAGALRLAAAVLTGQRRAA